MLIGLTTWIIAVILKITPDSWLKKIPIKIDENKEDDSDPLMKAYNSSAKGKLLKKEAETKEAPATQ